MLVKEKEKKQNRSLEHHVLDSPSAFTIDLCDTTVPQDVSLLFNPKQPPTSAFLVAKSLSHTLGMQHCLPTAAVAREKGDSVSKVMLIFNHREREKTHESLSSYC